MANCHRRERLRRSRIVGQMLYEVRAGSPPGAVEAAAGISDGYLLRLERGQRQPSVEVFISICKATKTDPGALIRKIAAAFDI